MAARKLGMSQLPVIVLDHLSRAQRRALVIAVNWLAQNAAWYQELLLVEPEALREDDFRLDLLGFEDAELDALPEQPATESASVTDDDAVQETPESAVAVPGEVRVLGDHQLFCVDATVMTDKKRPGRRPRRYGLD
jgi:ParB-like chromosome segregation protein Spo0J